MNEKRLTIIQIWLINFLNSSVNWMETDSYLKVEEKKKKSLVKMSNFLNSFKMSFNMFNFSYHIARSFLIAQQPR